jgi:hypothetical protein
VRAGALSIAALAVALCAAVPAGAATAPRSCNWFLEPTYDHENVLFPEVTTRYLGGIVIPPPGGYVEITGEYPHARYMSLQTYSSTLQSTSVLRDTRIHPDEGSVNPYKPGGNRNAKRRSYTVRLVQGQPPAEGQARNTLYNTSADGTQRGNGIAYRIYLPDRGTDRFGDAPTPKLALVTAGGDRIPVPDCPDLVPDTSVLGDTLAEMGAAGFPLPGIGVLAERKTVWHRYVNAPTSYGLGLTENDLTPEELETAVSAITVLLPAGLGENADNKYVAAYLSQEFGSIALITAKMPTTPRTLRGQRRMPKGKQLRFWSMCTGHRATITLGCVTDEDIPVTKKGNFQVVMSTKAARPESAKRRCGFAWVPWGPDPKGIAIMRNMLPSKRFHHAVQNAEVDHEKEAMGRYYPRTKYIATAEDFDEKYAC